MLRNMAAIFLCMLTASAVSANQYIVTDAIVTKVGSTAGNGESFWVVAKHGQGSCVSQSSQVNVYFPRTAVNSEKIFDRAYAAALSALTTGKRVNIYNYADSSCDKAVAIELLAN